MDRLLGLTEVEKRIGMVVLIPFLSFKGGGGATIPPTHSTYGQKAEYKKATWPIAVVD